MRGQGPPPTTCGGRLTLSWIFGVNIGLDGADIKREDFIQEWLSRSGVDREYIREILFDQLSTCRRNSIEMPFTPTDEQYTILSHDATRHARVLAGPGTGKSTTMVALLGRLLEEDDSLRVRMLTFTRAATAELAEKIASHSEEAERPSTIHSFAISVLLRNPGTGGFPEPLRIADTWEFKKVIRPTLAKRVGVQVRVLDKLIQEMASNWESLTEEEDPEIGNTDRTRFRGAWAEHRRILGYTLLQELPYALRRALHDHDDLEGIDFDLLLVDEYQDLNSCDLEVIRLISEKGGCVVIGTGDDDQSIIREELDNYDIDYSDHSYVLELLEQQDNRRLLELLRLLVNRNDSIAWASLLHLTDGIGETFFQYVYDRAKGEGTTFATELLSGYDNDFPDAPVSARKVKTMLDSILPWLEENDLPDDQPEQGWGHWIVDVCGYEDFVPEPTDDFEILLLNLDDLAEEQQSLQRYLGQIEPLGKDLAQAQSEGIRIMTMGGSKGLTARATIIAGVEDGLIPRPHSNLSEERRILYVAMTRAKEYLFCTWAARRRGPTARAGHTSFDRRCHSEFLNDGPIQSENGRRFIRDRF